jgi:hypothetical protein
MEIDFYSVFGGNNKSESIEFVHHFFQKLTIELPRHLMSQPTRSLTSGDIATFAADIVKKMSAKNPRPLNERAGQ